VGGRVTKKQEQVGGWPALESQAAPVDSDNDGMPNSWERCHGLNPHDPTDAATDNDKDGYTNLEEYLNDTDPKKIRTVSEAPRRSGVSRL
jgi:hypothetical protein